MTVRDDLQRWAEAGLIDAATVERIIAFETARAQRREPGGERLTVTEILIYLAGAITGAGVAVLTGTNWEHLGSAARMLVPASAAVATFAVGAWARRGPGAAVLRGASLLWLVAGALATVTAAVVASEAGWSEDDVALASGVTALAVSILLWLPMRAHPQVVGMGAAAFLFSSAISGRVAEDWVVGTLGCLLAAFGAAMLVATERGVLVPRASARLVAAAGLAFGGFYAGMPPSPAALMVVTAAAVAVLLASGLRYGSLVYVAAGVAAAFAAMLILILRYVDNPTLAGLALVALGLLLMMAVLAVGRARPWVRWHSGPPGGAAGMEGRAAPGLAATRGPG